MLVILWWMGFGLLGIVMLVGVVGAVVMMGIGIRQVLVARKQEKKARTS